MSIRPQSDGTVNICNKLFGVCKKAINLNNATAINNLTIDQLSTLNRVPFSTCASAITNLSSSTLTSSNSLYNSSFTNSGMNASAYMAYMAAKFGSNTFEFIMPIFMGIDQNGNYNFNATLYNSATNSYFNDFGMIFDSNCLLVGNQWPFDMTVSPMIQSETRVDGVVTNNVTSGPVSGLWFKIGSDRTDVAQPVQINGVTPAAFIASLCDLSNLCTQIATATLNTGGGATYFTLDSSNYTGTNYSFLNLIPYSNVQALNFYNGNPRSLQLKFYSDNAKTNQIGTSYNLSMLGDIVPQSVADSLTMPTITNATSILTNGTANPTVNFVTNSGILVAAITIQRGTSQKINMVVSSTSGSTTFNNYSYSGSDVNRSLYVNFQIPGNPSKITTKYEWAPTCNGCY